MPHAARPITRVFARHSASQQHHGSRGPGARSIAGLRLVARLHRPVAMRSIATPVILAAFLPAIASADTYAEEPTAGLALPAAPLAGELDGRVVTTNPGGIVFVRGAELALALD